MQAIKKISGIIIDILITFVIIAATIVTIITLTSNEDGIPNIMGYSPFSIQSNSMYPELKKGQLIIVKRVDIDALKVNDIISFYDTIDGENVIITHRIVNITNNDVKLFTTKGDNNLVEDDLVLTEVDIIGKYIGIKIPVIGAVIDVFKSKWGFLLFIIFPLIIIFIYHLIGFIKLVVEEKELNE